MGKFLKTSGIFIFLGFVLVVIVGAGLLFYQRFQNAKKQTELPETPKEQSAELSFTLEGTPTPTQSQILQCTNLSYTIEKDQLSIVLVGNTKAVAGSTVTFMFSYGDGLDESIDNKILDESGTDSQTVLHTYKQPGTYTASLSLSDDEGHFSNTCETEVTVVSEAIENIPPGSSNNPIAQAPSISPSITQKVTPTPTKKPTNTPTPTRTQVISLSPAPFPTIIEDESIPVPNVPTAGGFAPTVAAALGGSGVLLLAFLLRKVAP